MSTVPVWQTALQGALDRIDDRSKGQAYAAWLGYYNSSLRDLRWTKEQLVQQANAYALTIGCVGVPPLLKKTVGMMGLRGVPGLNVVSFLPDDDRAGGGNKGGSNNGGRRNNGNSNQSRQESKAPRSAGPADYQAQDARFPSLPSSASMQYHQQAATAQPQAPQQPRGPPIPRAAPSHHQPQPQAHQPVRHIQQPQGGHSQPRAPHHQSNRSSGSSAGAGAANSGRW